MEMNIKGVRIPAASRPRRSEAGVRSAGRCAMRRGTSRTRTRKGAHRSPPAARWPARWMTLPCPHFSPGFADRVLAAAEARPAPLPELRRSGGGGGRRAWVAAGPAYRHRRSRLRRAWRRRRAGDKDCLTASICPCLRPKRSGRPSPARRRCPHRLPRRLRCSRPPIPHLLRWRRSGSKARSTRRRNWARPSARIDEVRQGRIEARRQTIDRRIGHGNRTTPRGGASRADRRGGSPPARTDRGCRAAAARIFGPEQIETRREELRERVENGEALTRGEIVPPLAR